MRFRNVILTRPYYECPYQRHQTTPPLGLGYLASYLLRHTSATVRIIDGHLLRLKPPELAAMINAQNPILVGISCLTSDYPYAVDLCRRLKRLGNTVVMGGVHPTALPDQTLVESGADYVVMGEGEIPLRALVEGHPLPAVVRGNELEFLDDLPFPAWELMPPARYARFERGGTKHSPVGIIMTSRGCPYNCSFCTSPQMSGRRIRYHSPANVVGQVRMLIEDFGVKEIQFEDDNLTQKRSHIEGICEGLLEAGIRIPWSCPNGIRADRVDSDMLRLMKEAGCHYTAIGIESADQGILDRADKGESIERIRQVIADAEDVGIRTHGFFILGLPGETKETIHKTVTWAVKSRLTTAQFSVLDVLPGSRLWLDLAGQFKPDWDKVSYLESEWTPEGLLKSELKRMQIRAIRRFVFSSPRRIWVLIKMLRLAHIRQILGRLRRYAL